jgi:hypothetical protein
MMTSIQCLAKADELDRLGYDCPTLAGREAFAVMGVHWRRTAAHARQHEAWEAAHP